MGLAGSLGGSLAGRFGASLGGGGRTPLTIYGAANVLSWVNGDNRAMGTPPSVETLSQLARATGSPTQASAPKHPQLVSRNSKNWVEYTGAQALRAASASPPFVAAGETQLACWISMKLNTIVSDQFFEFSDGSANTGFLFLASSAGNVRARVFAGGSLGTKTVAYSDTGDHVWKIWYDGSNIGIDVDGSNLGGPAAKTGAITNNLDQYDIGQNAAGGANMDAIQHEMVLVNDASSTHDAAMLAYMRAHAGITP